ncbi:hypothetical protein QVD17_07316 [Tagetes erecta]|uniref:Uncharacterized protein n=1 Tax=Tagetes erecta TaxID=13708 RepID=A0AAD8LQ30_TARER|nr:hypothetical protein QVD17_07316 [Tagetes erecta]
MCHPLKWSLIVVTKQCPLPVGFGLCSCLYIIKTLQSSSSVYYYRLLNRIGQERNLARMEKIRIIFGSGLDPVNPDYE